LVGALQINGATDNLVGLKENVIMGNLIPAGTGVGRLKLVRIHREEEEAARAAVTAGAVEAVVPLEKVESQGT
jgi:DNA-directed RNA polymerase subunit beta'